MLEEQPIPVSLVRHLPRQLHRDARGHQPLQRHGATADTRAVEVELRLDAVCAHVERVAELREARVLRAESTELGRPLCAGVSLLHRAFERCAGRRCIVGKARGAM